MQSSEFVKKFSSWYLWKNILIMGLVVAVLGVGVKFGLDFYTHHGEAIPVPDLKHKRLTDAEHLLRELGLEIQVVDTGYVKSLPADCILEQSLTPGERVKSGHIIYVTINSPHTPTITLPDIIDNSSLREAMAKLTAMGFKLGTPKYIAGEKDWVYGVLVNGRPVNAGDKISVEATLIIQVGNGERSDDDSVDYIDPALPHPNEMGDDVDEFEVVTGSDSPTKGNDNVKENSAKTMPKE
jgi:putative transmembrane PASTA-domain protein